MDDQRHGGGVHQRKAIEQYSSQTQVSLTRMEGTSCPEYQRGFAPFLWRSFSLLHLINSYSAEGNHKSASWFCNVRALTSISFKSINSSYRFLQASKSLRLECLILPQNYFVTLYIIFLYLVTHFPLGETMGWIYL